MIFQNSGLAKSKTKYLEVIFVWASQVALVVKNPPANAGDAGSIPGWGRPPAGGYGNPLQYSCLENPMDRRDDSPGDVCVDVHTLYVGV